jgi:HAD superfamily hydrolase (TIGR01450 family)
MWLDHYRVLLCDLDGCLVLGDRPTPGARELIAYAGDRLFILSNNSTDTPESLSIRLARIGLVVPPNHLILAGATAVQHLAGIAPATPIAIYGSRAIVDYAVKLGLRLDDEHPHHVLLARDVRFSYARLGRIVAQIMRGASLVVSNLDLTHPGAGGSSVVETGALLAAIQACLPGLNYLPIGKPSSVMYEALLRRLAISVDELLAIGDNPATDGEGARRLGIRCVLVGPRDGMDYSGLGDMLSGKRLLRDSGPAGGPFATLIRG